MFDSVRGHVGMASVENEYYVSVLKITTAYALMTNDHNSCCSAKLHIIFFFSFYRENLILNLIHGSLDAVMNSYSTSFNVWLLSELNKMY